MTKCIIRSPSGGVAEAALPLRSRAVAVLDAHAASRRLMVARGDDRLPSSGLRFTSAVPSGDTDRHSEENWESEGGAIKRDRHHRQASVGGDLVVDGFDGLRAGQRVRFDR